MKMLVLSGTEGMSTLYIIPSRVFPGPEFPHSLLRTRGEAADEDIVTWSARTGLLTEAVSKGGKGQSETVYGLLKLLLFS